MQWVWTDSSTIKNRDMQSTKVAQLRASDVIEVARAANELSLHYQDARARQPDEDDASVEQRLVDREALSCILLKRKEIVLPPVQLGSGRERLEHKTAAFAFQYYLHTLSPQN